jgi:hypothetical protein
MTSFLGGITNYDKPRSWEKGGPSPGEQNEVIRCFGSQKNPSRDMPPPKKTIEERLAAKAQSLSKAAAKWRRKKHINASERDSDSDSSTTSETSTISRICRACPLRVKIVGLPTKTSFFGLP